MFLHQLINKIKIEDIMNYIINEKFKYEKLNISYYEQNIKDIKNIKNFRLDNNKHIIVLKEKMPNNNEFLINCFYINFTDIIENKKINKYSLLFIPWKEILQMNVCDESVKNLSNLELISEIIFQMIFFGSEKNSQIYLKKLDKEFNDYENNNLHSKPLEKSFQDIRKSYNINSKNNYNDFYLNFQNKEKKYINNLLNQNKIKI